jgi:hypothetical protein
MWNNAWKQEGTMVKLIQGLVENSVHFLEEMMGK